MRGNYLTSPQAAAPKGLVLEPNRAHEVSELQTCVSIARKSSMLPRTCSLVGQSTWCLERSTSCLGQSTSCLPPSISSVAQQQWNNHLLLLRNQHLDRHLHLLLKPCLLTTNYFIYCLKHVITAKVICLLATVIFLLATIIFLLATPIVSVGCCTYNTCLYGERCSGGAYARAGAIKGFLEKRSISKASD